MREVTIRSGEDLRRLRERVRDPKPVLKAIGALLESQAQKAFIDQRLGDFVWDERYPSQEDPFVNTAGVVSDFNESPGRRSPLSRRFERRPALMDTGALAGSFKSRRSVSVKGEDTVEVGTTLDYAAAHQWGLTTTQRISDEAKKGIRKWLNTEQGAPFKLKLWGLTSSDELETQAVQRPFLGITQESERDIAATVELFIAEGEV